MDLDFASVTAITIICFLICEAAKATSLNRKWLPTIAGVAGAALGAIGMTVIPNYPASDYINAVAVGIASGLASTGAHQIFKQLVSRESEEA